MLYLLLRNTIILCQNSHLEMPLYSSWVSSNRYSVGWASYWWTGKVFKWFCALNPAAGKKKFMKKQVKRVLPFSLLELADIIAAWGIYDIYHDGIVAWIYSCTYICTYSFDWQSGSDPAGLHQNVKFLLHKSSSFLRSNKTIKMRVFC